MLTSPSRNALSSSGQQARPSFFTLLTLPTEGVEVGELASVLLVCPKLAGVSQGSQQ
jgi:hypothetical protein